MVNKQARCQAEEQGQESSLHPVTQFNFRNNIKNQQQYVNLMSPTTSTAHIIVGPNPNQVMIRRPGMNDTRPRSADMFVGVLSFDILTVFLAFVNIVLHDACAKAGSCYTQKQQGRTTWYARTNSTYPIGSVFLS